MGAHGRTNLSMLGRGYAQWTGFVASGGHTGEPFPYVMGSYALGAVSLSGEPGMTGHIGLEVRNEFGLFQFLAAPVGSFASAVIDSPTAQTTHGMPPEWFNAIGTARLALTDGSGSGIPATATMTYGVSIKT